MSSLGAFDVFQPFRESSRAESNASVSSNGCGKVHYTTSGMRNLMTKTASSSSSNRSVQKNNGMMMLSGTSSSTTGVGDDLSQAYPLVNSTTANTEASTASGRLGASARLTTSKNSNNNNNMSDSGAAVATATVTRSSSNSLMMRTPSSSSLRRNSSKSLGVEDNSKEASSSSHGSSSGQANEKVIIEEKRRRSDGEGYTTHQYLRGRLLGKGGFAKVYMCTAMDTGKNYAVKVVAKANLVKARARQKLQAEIKIHRTLKHKHICQYKHYFEDRNNCYILLELCHNQSLNEMIKRRKRFTEPEAAYFLKQLIHATRYMHESNVIHRDLKLGNLFLDKNLHIKVGDLGLATRVEDKDEKRKTICGTPNYIAPEVIQGDKTKRGHSFEVDVWSIGVILYTILVGKPPYEAKDVKATYHRILANEYSFPSHVHLSPEVKDLIQCILKTDPKERPSLDYIESHPFLTENLTPESLPSSVLHRAPVWTKDAFGVLVLEEQMANQHPSKSAKLPRSNSSSRQPFASRNPNLAKAGENSNKESGGLFPFTKPPSRGSINVASAASSIVSSVSSASARKPMSAYSPGFKIFDETSSKAVSEITAVSTSRSVTSALRGSSSPSPRTAAVPATTKTLSEEAIITRTRALSIGGNSSTSRSSSSGRNRGTDDAFRSAKTTRSRSPAGRISVSNPDAEILASMIDQLEDVLSVTEARRGSYLSHSSPRPISPRGAPRRYVARYVDYTSKYGMGFLLNDGSAGVYFNDSTKSVLEPDGDAFLYIERKKDERDNSNNGGSSPSGAKPQELIMQTHTLSNYPDSLKKKVTLLTHFRNYLIEQQKKADNDGQAPPMPTSFPDEASSAADLVYVKKWMQTRHAILFRLSDHTVQVVFFDQTEVLLTTDTRFITYVDKQRRRATYSLTDELVGSSNEMEKRLKYTKEILQQLLHGQRR